MTARSLYERFSGHLTRTLARAGIRYRGRWLTQPARAAIDIPGEIAFIGYIRAIDYDAIYDGKLTQARHWFAPGARPLLAVGTARGQVFLIGDRYQFTDRGFVDFDSRGPIECNEKTGKVKRLKLDRAE